MKRRVLFLPIHRPAFLEMLPIAQKLAVDGEYEPVFFIFRNVGGLDVAQLASEGIRCIGPKLETATEKPKQTASTKSNRKQKQTVLKKFTRQAFSTFGFSFLWYLTAFGRQLTQARQTLKQEETALVVVVGDRHVGWETAFIRAANQMGIPSLIVPFALSDPLPDYRSRMRAEEPRKYQVKSWIERALAERFPAWVADGEMGPLFFVPPGDALAAKFWGMMPEKPWVLGGGNAGRMAVECPRMAQAFMARGVPREKMVITGRASVDQVYRTMQQVDIQDVRQSLGLEDGKSLLLCAVPQLAEHGLISWDEHWREIEFLFATLTGQDQMRVILSLHPKSDPDAYRPLADKYGAVIAPARIYELLPACDLFVATFSSTVMQAIGLGKPAIVVDFYGLDYTFYDPDEGVVVVQEHEALPPLLERLAQDPGYYEQLAAEQKKSSSEWVLLDGGCTARITGQVEKLIAGEWA